MLGRKRRADWGLIIGGLGLVVALVSAWIALSVRNEQTSISITGEGTALAPDPSVDGYSVRMSLVNSGLRPVVIRSMNLEVDGQSAAEVSGYVPRAPSLAVLSGDLAEEAKPLPFTLGERSGMTLTALLSFGRALYGDPKAPEVKAAQLFCRSMHDIKFSYGKNAPEVRLKVDVEPGGTYTIPVSANAAVFASKPWILSLIGSHAAPTGVSAFRRTLDQRATKLLTMKIYAEGKSGAVKAVSAPIFGGGPTTFSFPPLAQGSYQVLLFDQRRIVERAAFKVPVVGKHGAQEINRSRQVYDSCAALSEPPYAPRHRRAADR